MFRLVQTPPAASPVAAPGRRDHHDDTAVRGLEDDPDLWPAARGAWTALDELRLIRLLDASAPFDRPRPTSAGQADTQPDNQANVEGTE